MNKPIVVISILTLAYLVYARNKAAPPAIVGGSTNKRAASHDSSGVWKTGRIHAPQNQLGQTLRYWNGVGPWSYISRRFH